MAKNEVILNNLLSVVSGKRVVVVPGVQDIMRNLKSFQWPDYIFCSFALFIIFISGIYFIIYKSVKSTENYFLGERKLTLFPIALSLTASIVNGIIIIGITSETYLYGTQHIYLIIGMITMTILFNYLFLPVLHNSDFTSIYEYLEIRFDKKVRIFGSLLYILNMITLLPVMMNIPILAFQEVTNLNLYFVAPILCTVCILYTSLGGFKTIISLDIFHICFILGSLILVAIKGTLDFKNFQKILEPNLNSARIENPNLDLNLFTIIASCFYFLHLQGLNQNILQKYLSLPSLKTARRASWLCTTILILIILLCTYSGLLIYAEFEQCDPLTTGLIKQKVELLALFVRRTLSDYPILLGIVATGIYGAILSTWATTLNAITAVIIEDYSLFFLTQQLSEKRSLILSKIISILVGLVCFGLTFISQNVNTALEIQRYVVSIISGPSVGLFVMGTVIPWINAKEALSGSVLSMFVMIFLNYHNNNFLSLPTKELKTDGCRYHFIPLHHKIKSEEILVFYPRIYLWCTVLGAFISIIVGLILSFILKSSDPRDVDPKLLAPILRKMIKPREFPNQPEDGIIYAFKLTEKKNGDLTLQTQD